MIIYFVRECFNTNPGGMILCLTPDEEWRSHDESGAQRNHYIVVPKGRAYGRIVDCQGRATMNPSLRDFYRGMWLLAVDSSWLRHSSSTVKHESVPPGLPLTVNQNQENTNATP